jgi:hypothetical protein
MPNKLSSPATTNQPYKKGAFAAALDRLSALNHPPGILKPRSMPPDWLPPPIELAALYYRLHRSEQGAREKQIVERISERERQNKTKAKVIFPVLPSP